MHHCTQFLGNRPIALRIQSYSANPPHLLVAGRWYNILAMNIHTVTITSPEIWKHVQTNAAKVGLSVDEYVSRIVKYHVIGAYKDPWGPVPKEVSKRWDREIAEFEAEDRKNPQPSFTSAQEMVDYLLHHETD